MTNKGEKKMWKDVSSNLKVSNRSKIVAWPIIFKNYHLKCPFCKIGTILLILTDTNDFVSDFTQDQL